MRFRFILSLCVVVAIQSSLIAQYRTSEIAFGIDNDFFVPANEEERHYTLGFDIAYRHIPRNTKVQDNHIIRKLIPAINYLIIDYSAHMRTFTPGTYRGEDQFSEIGLPFSGYIYGQYMVNGMLPASNIQLGVNAGFMGPALGLGNVHDLVHRDTGEDAISGWENQISNRPTIHLVGKWSKNWFKTSFIALNSESSATVGNIFIHTEQEGRLILGKFRDLNKSVLYNNKLRNKNGIEMFLTLSGGFRLAAYNATIAGGVDNMPTDDESFRTDRSTNNLSAVFRGGVYASVKSLAFSVNINHHRGVVDQEFQHSYGSLMLTYTFRQFDHQSIVEGIMN